MFTAVTDAKQENRQLSFYGLSRFLFKKRGYNLNG